ncbi:DUF998 domain-containing protein, partial [Streptomyces sp. NPDC048352]|uniref:DUF998 domain-containing protein n=1 Tax=Streptomyces sp. NPDC048352 TaxID=3154718 RepID=UPI00341B1439
MRTHRPAGEERPRGRTGPVALLVGLGAAAYTAWVLEVVLSTGLNPIEAYVSELAAQDQPLGGLFRATDFTAGLLVFLGGLLALGGVRKVPPALRRLAPHLAALSGPPEYVQYAG